jgi:hypothetical protein
MPSSGMLRRVALVRTEVSEERSASIFNVTRIDDLGTTLAVTSNRSTLRSISSPLPRGLVNTAESVTFTTDVYICYCLETQYYWLPT